MAGARAALIDFGYPPAEMEKAANPVLGLLARGAGWAGKKVLGGVFGAGKGALKGAWGAASGGSSALAKPFGTMGNRAMNAVGSRMGLQGKRLEGFTNLGKGMANEAMGYGLLSGGINAAMAEPGSRGSAFASGFGTGVLGGMAFRGAQNVAGAGITKALGKHAPAMQARAGNKLWGGEAGTWGTRAKNLGAKALVGGVPLAVGTAASFMTPVFGGEGAPQSNAAHYIPPALRGGMGAGNMMGFRPPPGPVYNPNLPLPVR